MPATSLSEAFAAAVAAIVAGAGGVAIGRRRTIPGTPEDHEQRLVDLERGADDHAKLSARVAHMESQMQLYGERLTQAIDRLTESNDLIRRAVEIAGEKLDAVRDTVVRLDVEMKIERELRKQRPSSPEVSK